MKTNSASTFKKRLLTYAKTWEQRGYPEGIPDEADANLEFLGKVPSWRRICLAIIKNDITLKSLGQSRKPCELYMTLKRKELEEKGKLKPCQNEQNSLF